MIGNSDPRKPTRDCDGVRMVGMPRVKDVEHDRRQFRIIVQETDAAAAPEGPQMRVFVRAGDGYEPISEIKQGALGEEDQLMEDGMKRIKQWCFGFKPGIKFRCPVVGIGSMDVSSFTEDVEPAAVWEKNIEFPCPHCSGKHRLFCY
jgi:hypothetical protein